MKMREEEDLNLDCSCSYIRRPLGRARGDGDWFLFFPSHRLAPGPFCADGTNGNDNSCATRPYNTMRVCPTPSFHLFFYRFISFLPSKVSQSSVNDVLVRRHFSFSHVRSIHALSIYIAAGRGARNTFVIQHLYYVWSLSASFIALASLSFSLSLSGVASDRTESSRYSHLLLEGNKDDGNKRTGTKGGERGRE